MSVIDACGLIFKRQLLPNYCDGHRNRDGAAHAFRRRERLLLEQPAPYFWDMSTQETLFPEAAPAMPDGFRYHPALISPQEERALIEHISRLPLKPFEFHGYQGNRNVKAFGYRYDYARRRTEPAGDMPDFLVPLRRRIAEFAGRAPDDFAQVLATEYPAGAGIGWHRDKPQFEEVVGVSLLSPANFRLRKKSGAGWQRRSQRIEPRSAYLLSGSVRHDWEHSIPPQAAPRYSVTFRTLAAPGVK